MISVLQMQLKAANERADALEQKKKPEEESEVSQAHPCHA